MTPAAKPLPTAPLKFAWHVSRQYRGWLLLSIVFVILGTVAANSTTYVLKLVVDSATAYANEGTGTLKAIFFTMLLYPALILFEFLAFRGTSIGLHKITALIRTKAYRVLFDHLSLHSSTYFNDRFAGSLSSKINIVGGNMSRLANDLVWSYLWLIASLTTSFVIIATASLTLALVFLGAAIVMIPVNYFLTKPQLKLSAERARTMNVLRGQVVDTITNILAVRHYARRTDELARLDASILDHQVADVKADIYGEKVLIANNIILTSLVAFIVFGAFSLWAEGAMTLGEFVMIMFTSTSIIWGVSQIGQTMNQFVETYGDTKDSLAEILVPHDIKDAEGAKELAATAGAIGFEDVTFTYPGAKEPAFENFSIAIPAGQKVGLVGVSGSGKSSFIKLLLREHDLDAGTIRIDGQDIRQVTQDSLRSAIAIVPQDPLLFHRSLYENIAYGRSGIGKEEVEEAARKAQIHDFIENLPDKYETLVGERGVKLSGGQRQRVAIARAMAKAAPVLILDEATSSLDSESESKIQEALRELMQGKTVIAIAHRLSTIREMDRIVVLHDGKIIEDGTHDALLRAQGTYASLWQHQAGGFLQE